VIVLTTSRKPTPSTRTFCKFLERTFPGIIRINRGKSSISDLTAMIIEIKAKKLLIVDRWKGGPSKIDSYEVKKGNLLPFPPSIYIVGLRIVNERQRRISQIIIDRRSVQEVMEIAKTLSETFEVPLLFEDEASIKGGAVLRLHPDGARGVKAFTQTKDELGASYVTLKRVD
jgi:rRNA maturation protein Rpf1